MGHLPTADRSPAAASEQSLRKPTDGYLAQLDRNLSIAISKRLAGTKVTPNQLTSAGLAIGLLGAASLATGRYSGMLLGSSLLWASSVLDGCDGELARLKSLCSESGARYDLIADHLINFATFAAVVEALRRTRPDFPWAPAGLLLLSGILLSMWTVWRFILRPGSGRELPLFFERLASRDFVYVLLLFVLLRRLEWFVWAAALGSHFFWISLRLYRRTSPQSAAA